MVKDQQAKTKVLMKNYQVRPNCHLSTQNKFIHVPVVLCAFVEKLHVKYIWTIVQNTNVKYVRKLSSVTGHLKNINVTALQKDIHVQFVTKTTLENQTLISI